MPLENYKRLIVVHGEKPNKNNTPHREFLKRLEKTVELAGKGIADGIIVSGGTTRKNSESEASFGAAYLRNKVELPIFTEENSHTTIENIRFIKRMLAHCSPEYLIIVSSKKRMFRLKYLYGRLWPEMHGKIEFVGAPDSYGLFFYFVELTYLMYSIFDINESALARLTKKIFRNS